MKDRAKCLEALNVVYGMAGLDEVSEAQFDAELQKKWVADKGCDSLDTVEAAVYLEEEFNVIIPDEEVEALGTDFTVQQLLELAENKVAA